MFKSGKIIWSFVIMVIVIVGGLIFWQFNKDKTTEKPIINVGVLLPLSGVRAEAARYGQNGLNLVLPEINQNTKNKFQLNLVYEDTQYDPKLAISAFNKMKDLNGIKYFIGPYGSSEVMAVAPIAEQSKLILITPTAQTADVTKAGDYIFRTQTNVAQEAPVLAEYIYQRAKTEPIHLMVPTTEYGSSIISNFQHYYEKLGGQMGLIEKYNSKDTDFRTQLTKIKNQNAKYILLATAPNLGGMIIKQAKELGLTALFLSTSTIEGKELIDIGKTAVEGLIYIYPYDEESQDSVMKDYREKYQAKYQEKNEMYSANFYDTLRILSQCFESAGDNVEAVKKCLYATQNFSGASGLLSFDANGDISKPFSFKTVKDGQFVKVENY